MRENRVKGRRGGRGREGKRKGNRSKEKKT